MKKLLTYILILGTTAGAMAQNAIGLRGSFSGSTLTKFDLIENVTPDFKFLPAAGGAIFMEIPINSNFSVQPEISYTQKGFAIREGFDVGGKFLGIDIPVNGTVNFRANYVEVPVLAMLRFGDKSAAHSYIAIGPSVGYMADADMRIKVLDIFPLDFGLNDNFFKPFEFSGVVVAGFELPVSEKVRVFAEGRYAHGFSRVLDTGVVDLPVRSRTLSGGLGLKYTL